MKNNKIDYQRNRDQYYHQETMKEMHTRLITRKKKPEPPKTVIQSTFKKDFQRYGVNFEVLPENFVRKPIKLVETSHTCINK